MSDACAAADHPPYAVDSVVLPDLGRVNVERCRCGRYIYPMGATANGLPKGGVRIDTTG